MRTWSERPFEVRNLFNPAFCGLVLARSIHEYEAESGTGMPFSISLLILPLSLHKNSRQILAKSKRSYFLKVVEDHPELLVDFPTRASSMFPFSQEGFSLLASSGCLEVNNEGSLSIDMNQIKKTITGTDENRECQNVARYLGRQFARISDRITVYASLGVRP